MNCNKDEIRLMSSINGQRVFLLDYKRTDVTGDGIPDNIYLYGNKPDGAAGIYADNITLVIQDGRMNKSKAVTPEFNAGYHARVFLEDFDMDGVDDIKVTIDSGGSGGSIITYIYSYKKHMLRELFNFDNYNNNFRYKADFNDFYTFSVRNSQYDKLFVLDLSARSYDYLSYLYDVNGKLLRPVQGDVLSLGALHPIVTDENDTHLNLIAQQRIIGTTNADTLGSVQNLLTWDGQGFSLTNMSVSIQGTNLIMHNK